MPFNINFQFILASFEGHRSEWLRVRRIFFGNRPTPPPAPPFFVGGKRPEGLPRSGLDSVIEIEQRYPDIGSKIYFVTLFDKERNIPLYSAYKVTADEAKGIGRSGVSRKDKKRWRNPTFPGIANEIITRESRKRTFMGKSYGNTPTPKRRIWILSAL